MEGSNNRKRKKENRPLVWAAWISALALLFAYSANAYAVGGNAGGGGSAGAGDGANLVSNGDFSQGTADWWPNDAKFVLSAEDGWGKVTLVDPGASDWDVSLQRQTGGLVKDRSYRLSFDAKASAPRKLGMCLQGGAGFQQQCIFEDALGTTPKHYSLDFVAGADVEQPLLNIPIGGSSATVYLDNVYVGPPDGEPTGGAGDEPEAIALVDDSFDDQPAGSMPAGWQDAYAGAGSVSAAVYGSVEAGLYNRGDAANRTFRTAHLGWDANGVVRAFEAQKGKVTLEYAFLDNRKGAFSVIGLMDAATGAEAMNVAQGFYLKYNQNGDDAGSALGIQDYVPDTWVEVKVVADVNTQKFSIDVNGERKVTDANFLHPVDELDAVFVRHAAFASSDQQSNADMVGAMTYVDDVKVSAVQADVSEALSISGGELAANAAAMPAVVPGGTAVHASAAFANLTHGDVRALLTFVQKDKDGNVVKRATSTALLRAGAEPERFSAVFDEKPGGAPYAYEATISVPGQDEIGPVSVPLAAYEAP